MGEKSNSVKRNVAGMLGGNLAKYRVTRITRIKKDGQREVIKQIFEVDDIEAFRKKMKGRKFSEVHLVYESIF